MLGVVFTLPLVFGLVVWRSYRTESARSARGEDVSTPGKLRWSSVDPDSPGRPRGRES